MSTERRVGTVSRGIRCPIFREGDDLAQMVVDSVLEAAASDDGFDVRDRDIVCITESVVARCQGNYAGVEDIAADVKAKLGGKSYLAYTFKKQVCHLPERNCHGRRESSTHAQLSF